MDQPFCSMSERIQELKNKRAHKKTKTRREPIEEIGPVKGSIHGLEGLSDSLHPSEFYDEVAEGHTHACTHAHVNSHTHTHTREQFQYHYN